MTKQQAGHSFLAKLGKTRLRPGGKRVTDFLLEQGQFSADKKVLEVACNMGTTAIGLAKTYGCTVDGVDLDETALAKAQRNIAQAGLTDKITVQRANALKLPFADNHFDIVINEAMLTMLPVAAKQKAIAEYFRVLKPQGVLLTHDMLLTKENTRTIEQLREALNIGVTPLTENGWLSLFNNAGFSHTKVLTGKMSLVSPVGLVRDEGILGALNIIKNALKTENRTTFQKMFKFLNNPKTPLGFIAIASVKS